MNKFRQFWRSLNIKQREQFAKKADTSVSRIEVKLMPRDPLKRQVPRNESIARIAWATNGACTTQDAIDYFVGEEVNLHFEQLKAS